eukprot:6233867-Heterocapsa_arctica.AAC.1
MIFSSCRTQLSPSRAPSGDCSLTPPSDRCLPMMLGRSAKVVATPVLTSGSAESSVERGKMAVARSSRWAPTA